MTRRETLEACKEAYAHLRGQRQALNYLERTRPEDGMARQATAEQVAMLRQSVQVMEQIYRDRARAAQEALAPLGGREAHVLTQHYIYGATLHGIARVGKWDVRTVTRAKSRGLAKLDEMEGQS